MRGYAVSAEQWEKYVEPAARLLDPDAFDQLDPHHAHWALESRRQAARNRVRRVLGHAAPLIAQDTRERMVAAAARAVERACTSPRTNHGDGRGCEDGGCPRHGSEEDEG